MTERPFLWQTKGNEWALSQDGYEPAERLLVRMTKQINMSDDVTDSYYRLPDQDEIFIEELIDEPWQE